MKGRRLIAVLIAASLAPGLWAGCSPAPVTPPAVEIPPASATASPPATATLPPPASVTAPLPATAALPPPAVTRLPGSGLETSPPTLQPGAATPLPPSADRTPPEKRTRYTLDARLDYSRHSLAVEERIEYTNTTGESLAAIPLVVEALRYPQTFQLASVVDGAGEPLDHRLDGTTLTLKLPKPLAPEARAELALAYSLALPDVTRLSQVRPYPLGYTPTQANFGDWYPYIPPYVAGTGWLIHPPALFGEHLAYDAADFDVGIHLEGSLTSVVVAASAPEEREARPDGEWLRYRHAAARSFAWSASPYYEVITQTVETEAGSSTLLASYYFSFHAEAGKSLLAAMAQALPVYTRLFGSSPRPQLSGVQVDFMDGMEYDGLFFLSTDFYNWHREGPEDFLTALAAHETAHQWWMGLVGSDPAQEPWLDEALCTYSEHLFYENVFPEALEWWWAYRVNYYDPQGRIDITIYDTPGGSGDYRLYRDPVYLRGAQFLHELRAAMGDEAFFAALRQYADRYAYRHADAAGFFEIIRQTTDQDLSPITRKYFQDR